nr:RNA-directed DNA polymerase, eukaryota, reverse transcriptase zinc-binding domain protein [Tanacetum cinerariifolium]GFB21999.1 RNA-directed DNA polymerase, eukaryota, reverse transcriptase zinc-binding domain protein [Tanacetum cinerariifolium]
MRWDINLIGSVKFSMFSFQCSRCCSFIDAGLEEVPLGGSSFTWCYKSTTNMSKLDRFRPISLIGSIYKIIKKILANCLVGVLGDIVNEVQSAFIAERQILDDPFILNERVVDVGMFMGIRLTPSLNLSHMFYADDAVFVGQWCDGNINTLVHVLECFYRALGLRIIMSKSKIMGVHVKDEKVKYAASKLT